MDVSVLGWDSGRAMTGMAERDIAHVDERLAECADRWGLTLGAVASGGYRSLVRRCATSDGSDAVLKLTVTLDEAVLEARALESWADTGVAVRLLDVDLANGALLLERLHPASPLPGGDHPWMVDVVADLLSRLHSVGAVSGFPTLAELYPHLADHSMADLRYERVTRGEPGRATAAEELMDEAAAAAQDLCSTSTSTVLLHGDFLDKNLLLNGDRYVAVDPIPRLGEAESEVGFFACDHSPVPGIFERAEIIASRLGLDRERAVRWAAVWTVVLTTSAWRSD